MIVYNQAYDLYHTIYRLLQLLNKFEEDAVIEIDRLRIWDFYLLFPNKVHGIRLKRNEDDVRKLRSTYVKKKDNPYEHVPEQRKIFEKVRPYHIAALNCIASYGIIDKEFLTQNNVKILNKVLLSEYISKFDQVSRTENNIISLMTGHFLQISLYGTDGLKSRTNLMESKYDA